MRNATSKVEADGTVQSAFEFCAVLKGAVGSGGNVQAGKANPYMEGLLEAPGSLDRTSKRNNGKCERDPASAGHL